MVLTFSQPCLNMVLVLVLSFGEWVVIVNYKDLGKFRERHRDNRMVFCSGVFDLTHVRHAIFLDKCKQQGDMLVVMVGDDESVRAYKGEGRPVLNQWVRLHMVDHLKPVDYCFVGPKPEGHLLGFVEYVLEHLRPDKYVVQDDAFDLEKRRMMAERYGVELVVIPKGGLFLEISTSYIVERIKRMAGI